MTDKNDIYKKYRYAISLGVAIFIGLILSSFLVVRPMYLKTKSLFSEASARKKESTYLKDKKSKLLELSKRESEILEEEKKVSIALPASNEVGRIFIQLDQLVLESGGTTQSIYKSGSQMSVAGEIVATSYSIPTSFPNYFAYKEFLDKSASALRLLNLQKIQIYAGQDGRITSNLITETFSRK